MKLPYPLNVTASAIRARCARPGKSRLIVLYDNDGFELVRETTRVSKWRDSSESDVTRVLQLAKDAQPVK